jgi:hypothetical protein
MCASARSIGQEDAEFNTFVLSPRGYAQNRQLQVYEIINLSQRLVFGGVDNITMNTLFNDPNAFTNEKYKQKNNWPGFGVSNAALGPGLCAVLCDNGDFSQCINSDSTQNDACYKAQNPDDSLTGGLITFNELPSSDASLTIWDDFNDKTSSARVYKRPQKAAFFKQLEEKNNRCEWASTLSGFSTHACSWGCDYNYYLHYEVESEVIFGTTIEMRRFKGLCKTCDYCAEGQYNDGCFGNSNVQRGYLNRINVMTSSFGILATNPDPAGTCLECEDRWQSVCNNLQYLSGCGTYFYKTNSAGGVCTDCDTCNSGSYNNCGRFYQEGCQACADCNTDEYRSGCGGTCPFGQNCAGTCASCTTRANNECSDREYLDGCGPGTEAGTCTNCGGCPVSSDGLRRYRDGCSGTSPGGCVDCPACDSTTQYRQGCGADNDPTNSGTCVDCTAHTPGVTYVTTPCTDFADAVTSVCSYQSTSELPSGSYVSRVCSENQDTQKSVCGTCDELSYEDAPCIGGDSSNLGSPTVCATCNDLEAELCPAQDQYMPRCTSSDETGCCGYGNKPDSSACLTYPSPPPPSPPPSPPPLPPPPPNPPPPPVPMVNNGFSSQEVEIKSDGENIAFVLAFISTPSQ